MLFYIVDLAKYMGKKFSTYSDDVLVSILNDKDGEAAFTELYERYAPPVHAYCLRVTNDEALAEDIFQDTFIRFYQSVKQKTVITNVPGYLITIARNLCLNAKRDAKQNIPVDEFTLKEEFSNNFENVELLELITMALDLLDFDYREAFILREYDGMRYEEIAKICNTSASNAKSRVHRAKQKIKEILEPYLKEFSRVYTINK